MDKKIEVEFTIEHVCSFPHQWEGRLSNGVYFFLHIDIYRNGDCYFRFAPDADVFSDKSTQVDMGDDREWELSELTTPFIKEWIITATSSNPHWFEKPALINVEFTPYGICVITFPDGSEATMQGEEAAEFENSLREAEENFKESEAFATYEDLEQKLLSAYSEVAQLPEET